MEKLQGSNVWGEFLQGKVQRLELLPFPECPLWHTLVGSRLPQIPLFSDLGEQEVEINSRVCFHPELPLRSNCPAPFDSGCPDYCPLPVSQVCSVYRTRLTHQPHCNVSERQSICLLGQVSFCVFLLDSVSLTFFVRFARALFFPLKQFYI